LALLPDNTRKAVFAALLMLSVFNVNAATCVRVNALGQVVNDSGTAPNDCSDFMILTTADYQELNDPFKADDANWDVVVWACGAGLLMWAVGIGVGMLVNVVKKAR